MKKIKIIDLLLIIAIALAVVGAAKASSTPHKNAWRSKTQYHHRKASTKLYVELPVIRRQLSVPKVPCDPDTDECYLYGSTFEESWDNYEPQQMCRSKTKARSFKTWWGYVTWRYRQKVRWCYNGVRVTSMERTRWPEVFCCVWQFSGNVLSNCQHETCWEKTGHASETVTTVGSFKYCYAFCVREVNPGIEFTAYANGNWAWRTYG
jgi:hypothetical protein